MLQTSGQGQGPCLAGTHWALHGQIVAVVREPQLGFKLENSKNFSSQEQQYSWEQCDALD